jgi:hypothetical protein
MCGGGGGCGISANEYTVVRMEPKNYHIAVCQLTRVELFLTYIIIMVSRPVIQNFCKKNSIWSRYSNFKYFRAESKIISAETESTPNSFYVGTAYVEFLSSYAEHILKKELEIGTKKIVVVFSDLSLYKVRS